MNLVRVSGAPLRHGTTLHLEYVIRADDVGQPVIHLFHEEARKQALLTFPDIDPGVSCDGSELRKRTWAERLFMERIVHIDINTAMGNAKLLLANKETLSCEFALNLQGLAPFLADRLVA